MRRSASFFTRIDTSHKRIANQRSVVVIVVVVVPVVAFLLIVGPGLVGEKLFDGLSLAWSEDFQRIGGQLFCQRVSTFSGVACKFGNLAAAFIYRDVANRTGDPLGHMRHLLAVLGQTPAQPFSLVLSEAKPVGKTGIKQFGDPANLVAVKG
jgi:hypothetical protein